jgi:hypothetical protein
MAAYAVRGARYHMGLSLVVNAWVAEWRGVTVFCVKKYQELLAVGVGVPIGVLAQQSRNQWSAPFANEQGVPCVHQPLFPRAPLGMRRQASRSAISTATAPASRHTVSRSTTLHGAAAGARARARRDGGSFVPSPTGGTRRQGRHAGAGRCHVFPAAFILPPAPSGTIAVTPVQKHSISLCHKRKCVLKLQPCEISPHLSPVRRTVMAAGGQ